MECFLIAPTTAGLPLLEEEVTNVAAQSGKEAQELLSGGSDGPELQESQEDAANLKQASTWKERVGLPPETGLI